MNDWQLLQEYALRGSEAAFRSLTERHLNLVYSAALRQVNDSQLAEEICQTVFILLARKAGSLKPNVALAGWLFRTTRFVAARTRRGEQRRQLREQEAFEMQQLTAPDPAWPRLAPALDEALAHLGETDRNALLLRFFAGKSLKETGAALGTNEEAARKRISRALDKLRALFAGRGLTLSAAVLASALATHAAKAAPADLAGRIASAACAGGKAIPAALPALTRDVLRAWRYAGLKLAAWSVAGCAGVLALLLTLLPGKPAAPGLPSNPSEPAPATPTAASIATPLLTPSRVSASPAPKATNQTLILHVVAKDTGEPVAYAQLTPNTVVDQDWRQRDDLFTDVSGTAEVPYPPGTTRLDVGVLSSGWNPRFATWVPARQDPIPAEYTLRLERVAQALGGWLRDAQDRPLADAEVILSFLGPGDFSGQETPRERPGLPMVGHPVAARSDDNGWWTCAVIDPTNHPGFALEARHPACRPTSIISAPPSDQTDQTGKLELLWAGKLVTHLRPALFLVGRVLDASGSPVPKAVLSHEPYSTDPLVVSTDAAGQFAFTNIEDGDFDFTITAPGFAPEYREVSMQEEMEPLEIRLKPGALLRLRLADQQDEPVVGAQVVLEQWGDRRLKLKWVAQSGSDGRIEWSSAPPDADLELSAFKAGWCYSRQLRFKADGEEHLIPMQPARDLPGWVTDAATGQPITEFKAFPGYGEGEDAWQRFDTRHGTNGQFTVHFEEQPRPWRVRVEAEGYAPFVSEPLSFESTATLKVALRRSEAGR